jgi:hypothetical protein
MSVVRILSTELLMGCQMKEERRVLFSVVGYIVFVGFIVFILTNPPFHLGFELGIRAPILMYTHYLSFVITNDDVTLCS